MSQISGESELQAWGRQVAIACNNRAWELSTRPRTPAEDRELLDAAHTASYHWGRVGTQLNRMRATMLLAEVHALLGHGSTALQLASEMRDYFLGRDDIPDWELAFTHTVYAHCAQAAGQAELHRAAYHQAVTAIAAIASDEERSIVQHTFRQVAPPSND